MTAFEVGLTPDQFWQLTAWEFGCACRGHGNRIETQKRIAAVYTRALMSCWVKASKLPSINAMLGAKSIKGLTKEQIREHYADRQRGR